MLLNRYLGSDDIQIGSWPETIEAGGRMNSRAVKDAFLHPSTTGHSIKMLVANSAFRRRLDMPRVVNASIKRRYKGVLGPNASCPTAQAVMQFDAVAWDSYFKFGFTRNPFDFEVSDYFWRTKKHSGRVGFKEFLMRKLDKSRADPEGVVPFPPTNWPIYSIDDSIALDYIGRFEQLSDDLRVIGRRLGLPFDLCQLPMAKSNTSKAVKTSDFYDDESREMVFFLHRDELEYFGYQFPV